MRWRRPLAAALAAAGAGVLVASALPDARSDPFVVRRLVSDRADPSLVNAWGLAATPTGPWWVANEARNTSTLYAGDGRKQALTISVDCGPTGVAAYTGAGFVVRSGSASGPARFVYACEDGTIRAWSPTVPHGWSKTAVVAVDERGSAAVFKGVAIARGRLYATDFHNRRVLVFDSRWRRVQLPRGAFVDPAVPVWFQPFDIRALGGRIFVSYAQPAGVGGNDQPTGGYVDEYSANGKLLSRVAGSFDEPWGLALAPRGFGRLGGDLVVANFGTGHIDAYARSGGRWTLAGRVADAPGVWGIAFGNGHLAGPRTTLFYAAGPHRWRGSSELLVHGAFGAVTPAR
jgi:uncharacterized protein (TIGR03118 family)